MSLKSVTRIQINNKFIEFRIFSIERVNKSVELFYYRDTSGLIFNENYLRKLFENFFRAFLLFLLRHKVNRTNDGELFSTLKPQTKLLNILEIECDYANNIVIRLFS